MTTVQSSPIDDFDLLRGRSEANGSHSHYAGLVQSSIRFEFLGLSVKTQHLLLFALAAVSGLLFGLFIVGLLLWPVGSNNGLDPEQWSADYQRLFVTRAAENYGRTGNAAQAQASFADWNQADLANLLLTMQRQTTDTETRRQLVALSQALRLPVSESSPMSLIGQPAIVLGIFLSALPLLAAFALVSLPRLRKREQAPEGISAEAIQPEERLEELIGLESVDPLEMTDQEQKTEEEKKEELPTEETDEQSSGLGDLASLFEEEDTSINVLEAFCKGMPEINVDELLATAMNMVQRLRHGSPIRSAEKEN